VKLVVGLGNPGQEYEGTRHNVGWWVVDHLADVWRFPEWRAQLHARGTDATVDGHTVRLLEPLTFMNLSGDALVPYTHRPFWAVSNDLLVVVDDVSLPLGAWRFRAKGSSGGHNGLRSIEDALGTQEYARLRIGIGQDRAVPGEALRDFVLGAFDEDEATVVRQLLPTLHAGISTWITDGILAAMNRYPGRLPGEQPSGGRELPEPGRASSPVSDPASPPGTPPAADGAPSA
jgi:PTH1 family peptidyl-tRNA hydrolase